MREFVRTDLPELVSASERARLLLARTSILFAILAGIGADRLFGDAVRAIVFAILEVAPVERFPRPYDFQEILGPATGLLVARRAGGVGGALGYLAYSGTILVIAWIARALTCAGVLSQGQLGVATFCAYGPLDLLAGALPLFL